MIQTVAALVSLVLSLIVIAVALLVARRATIADAGGYAAVYRARRYYATGLIAGLAVLLLFTLSRTPYARAAETPAHEIEVVSRMWSWELRGDGGGASFPLEVPAHELVELAVTSEDVNHGFGIYDPEGRLIAQTQAMPGYVNHLLVRFERPGTYHVLCLEYCGVGHTVMMAEIAVR